MGQELLRIENVSKAFGGNAVLNGISLSVGRGQVVSVLGENGAGKTTLMKILSGLYCMDSGSIWLDGRKVDIQSPKDAHNLGIRMIYQDSQYLKNFTVAQSFFIGSEIVYKGTRFINFKRSAEEAERFLKYLECGFSAHDRVGRLTLAQKKMMDIAKAIYFQARLIIMDEPTLAFDPIEIANLFRLIRKLKGMGIAVIYISHRIEEVLEISDKIVTLRDGAIIGTEETPQQFDANILIDEIAGEYRTNRYPKTKAPAGGTVLEVRHLSNATGAVKDVSFNLRRGEILGVSGLQGAGKSTLARLVAGVEPYAEGHIWLNGSEFKVRSPCEAVRRGVVYLDQYSRSNLFLNRDATFNITLPSLQRLKGRLLVSRRKARRTSLDYIRRLGVRPDSPDEPIRNLSGGNQKKVALARWILADSQILVMDDPSSELDIVSKVELYNIMNQLTFRGKSIILITSDLKELVGMSDRIIILFDGRIAAELKQRHADARSILAYATGRTPSKPQGGKR